MCVCGFGVGLLLYAGSWLSSYCRGDPSAGLGGVRLVFPPLTLLTPTLHFAWLLTIRWFVEQICLFISVPGSMSVFPAQRCFIFGKVGWVYIACDQCKYLAHVFFIVVHWCRALNCFV